MSAHGWMRIEMKNFGPIASGSFELRPLTLFIGPNNSGKSYAAMLAYSMTRTILEAGILPTSMALRIRILKSQERKEALPTVRELIDQLLSSKRLQEALLERFRNHFSCEDLKDLVSRFALEDAAQVRIYARDAQPALISIEGRGSRWSVHGQAPALAELKESLKPEEPLRFLYRLEDIWIPLAKALGLPTAAYYLPAARSGVLQGWRVLASEAVRRVSRWAGIEAIEVPRLPGLIGEFLAELIEISEAERGLRRRRMQASDLSSPVFQSVLEVLEGELLRGVVDFSSPDGEPIPDILYRIRVGRKKMEIPIRRTSSTVGELAPLILWIKHRLGPGDMLIIEEPEAHLHPENQRRVARALVRLARAGVTVLCTTHSPLILHQISNHLLAAGVDPSRRKKLGFTEHDLLREDEVGVYLFRMRKDGRGSEIEPLAIEPGFGIPEEEFVRVSEAIGEETYRLTSALKVSPGEE